MSITKSPPKTRSDLPQHFEYALVQFLRQHQRQLSHNTRTAYDNDLRRYLASLHLKGIAELESVTFEETRQAVNDLETLFSAATVARNICSIRRFHRFLLLEGICRSDPTEGLQAPKHQSAEPAVLSVAEVENLLSAVKGLDPLSLRNRALLEIMYACGLRVSEIITLKPSWLQPDSAFIRIPGGASTRLVPIGKHAVWALDRYTLAGRPKLLGLNADGLYFLNARGGPLSRMGVWKIFRAAADTAGLSVRIHPSTLRHTFARHLILGGASLQDVQYMLGHRNLVSTLTYASGHDSNLFAIHRTCHPRG